MAEPRPPSHRRATRAACLALAAALQAGAALAQPAAEAPVDLGFADVFARPIGPHGLDFTERLRAAAGRQVRVVGYVVPREQPVPGRFLLTPRPVRLSEHADGEADDLPPSTITVLLDPTQQDRVVAASAEPVALAGRLELGRLDDGSGRVSWLRLRLAPDALAGLPIATSNAAP